MGKIQISTVTSTEGKKKNLQRKRGKGSLRKKKKEKKTESPKARSVVDLLTCQRGEHFARLCRKKSLSSGKGESNCGGKGLKDRSEKNTWAGDICTALRIPKGEDDKLGRGPLEESIFEGGEINLPGKGVFLGRS